MSKQWREREGNGGCLSVGIIKLLSRGSTNEGVEMLNTENMGDRAEVMFIKTMGTSGVGVVLRVGIKIRTG